MLKSIKNKSIEDVFPKVMFWDVDMNKIFLDNDADFIIDRVLNWYMDDVKILDLLDSIYPIDMIKYYAVNMDVRGNETIEFICNRYNLKISQFKYYLTYA